MDQLKFNILTQVLGTEGVKDLKNQIAGLGNVAGGFESKLTKMASASYLFEKGIEVARMGLEQFKEVLEVGDNLAVLSEKTGIAVNVLTQFQNAAKQSNVPVEALEKTLKKFNQNLGDPNNSKFKDTLRDIGVSARDANGNLKGSDVVLKQVSDKFASMKDGPQKAAAAVALFGKSGSDIIPILNMGSEEIENWGLKMANEFPERARKFNDAIEATNKLMLESKIAIMNDMLPSLSSIIDSYNEVQKMGTKSNFGTVLGPMLVGAADIIYETGMGIVNVADTVLTAGLDIMMMLKAFVMDIWEGIKGIGSGLLAIAKLDFRNIFSGFKGLGGNLAQFLKDQRELGSNLWDRVSERGEKAHQFGKLLANGFQAPGEKPKEKTSAPELENDKYASQIEKMKKYVIAQNEIIAKEKFTLENYAMSTSEMKKNTIAMELRAQAAKETVGWENESANAYKAATEAIIVQRLALVDMEQQQKQSFVVGAKIAFRDYLERIRDVAAQTKMMFDRAFQNMEDSLVNFVKTGQMNFRQFADAIIDDLARIAVRQAMLGVLTSVGMGVAGGAMGGSAASSSGGTGYLGGSYTFANGGIMTSSGKMNLKTYSNGGIANSPQLALYGEGRMPEAYVPLPDGKTIPVTMKGQGGGNSVVISISVNPTTGEATTSGSEDPRFKALAESMAAVAKNQIAKEMRPGGLLYG